MFNMAKKVIYTCITDGYDTLSNPSRISKDYDYICFTDDPNLKSSVWNIRPIPNELNELDKVKIHKALKICPHKYLSEYDMSVWVDGNTSLNIDVDSFVDSIIDDEHCIFLKTHPSRKCAYKEKEICSRMKKDDDGVMSRQMDAYRKEGFPTDYGLSENNFIIRFHNDKRCMALMEMWLNEVLNGSRRDQLSLQFCIWRIGCEECIKYFKPTRELTPKLHRKYRLRK